MNDAERAELWKRLRLEEAEALEAIAMNTDPKRDNELQIRALSPRIRINKLREAEKIRAQVAACDDVFDAATRPRE